MLLVVCYLLVIVCLLWFVDRCVRCALLVLCGVVDLALWLVGSRGLLFYAWCLAFDVRRSTRAARCLLFVACL